MIRRQGRSANRPCRQHHLSLHKLEEGIAPRRECIRMNGRAHQSANQVAGQLPGMLRFLLLCVLRVYA